MALTLGVIGSTWQAIRATASERAARLAKDTAQRERDHARSSRNRAVASINALLLQGSGDQSLITEETRLYRKALIEAGMRESQELVRELENDGRARLLLLQAYDTLSRTQYEGGDRAAAIATTQKGIALAQTLFDEEHSIAAGRALGSALQHLGTIASDRETSLPALRRCTAIFQALLAEHPGGDREEWIHMIALNHHDSGHREYVDSRFPGAIESFLAARTTWQKLLAEFGPSRSRSNHAAATERYLCRAYPRVGRRDDALLAGRRAIEIFRALLGDRPRRLRIFPAAQPGIPRGGSHSPRGRADERGDPALRRRSQDAQEAGRQRWTNGIENGEDPR